MACITGVPDDVLWLVLREVIYDNVSSTSPRKWALLEEYQEGRRGYYKDGNLAHIMLDLAHTHRTFRKCIRRRCIWHKTWYVDGWDFVKGSFREECVFVSNTGSVAANAVPAPARRNKPS